MGAKVELDLRVLVADKLLVLVDDSVCKGGVEGVLKDCLSLGIGGLAVEVDEEAISRASDPFYMSDDRLGLVARPHRDTHIHRDPSWLALGEVTELRHSDSGCASEVKALYATARVVSASALNLVDPCIIFAEASSAIPVRCSATTPRLPTIPPAPAPAPPHRVEAWLLYADPGPVSFVPVLPAHHHSPAPAT